MDKTMTRFLAILAALTCAASAQTYRTVTADTNNVIRTNFTIGAAQVSGLSNITVAVSNVTGLQSVLDGKLDTNASAVNVTGVVAITNGGTGATNAAEALVSLLPSYTSNETKVLALNSNATEVVWATDGGLIPDVGSATGVLAITNGGTGATNAATALNNFGVVVTNSTQSYVALGRNALAGDNANDLNIAIGDNAGIGNSGGPGTYGIIVIGAGATNGGLNVGGISIGMSAVSGAGGVSVGNSAFSQNSIAIGKDARVTNAPSGVALGMGATITNGTNAVQLGAGNNNVNNTIQFLSAGTIDTNEWARIAALSTYPTTNISVVGTNNTNTLVFSNGILVEVQ